MVIERALAAGYEPRSFVMIDSLAEEMCQRFEEIIYEYSPQSLESYKNEPVPVYVADYETIAGMTGVNITRGVLAIMKRKELPLVSELLDGCRRVAVFDDVENPTNIGAMFRSAAALGIDAVLLVGASSDPLYRRASRVSVGTVFQIPWTYISSWYDPALLQLRSEGFKTVALALSPQAIPINHPALLAEERLIIVLGTEGDGLQQSTIDACDYQAIIPMQRGVDSLNVAAAAAVAFWQLRTDQ
jgi:tRNA G18 (ribose-2'-O)-methylase SpoU